MPKDKSITRAPISKVIEAARESPSLQANIGWNVLIEANFAGIANLRELFDIIAQHEQEETNEPNRTP